MVGFNNLCHFLYLPLNSRLAYLVLRGLAGFFGCKVPTLLLIVITFDFSFHAIHFRKQTQTLIIVLSALRVTSRTMLSAFCHASKLAFSFP